MKKKKWKKMIKKWKKRGKLQFSKKENCNFPRFFHFFIIFFHFFHVVFIFLIFYHFSSIPPLEVKMIKKKWKKSTKIAIFYFSDNFCTTGSKNDEKWLKNEKNEKKLEENCNFSFFGKLHVFRVFFHFFFFFFIFLFFYHFSLFFIIFHQSPLEAKMIKKNDKNMKKTWGTL